MKTNRIFSFMATLASVLLLGSLLFLTGCEKGEPVEPVVATSWADLARDMRGIQDGITVSLTKANDLH